MKKLNPKVDDFLNQAKKWREEMEHLRMICLDSGLTEELKWRVPCYTFQKSNVAVIGGFKSHCVLSFFKGALLKDPQQILQKPGENTQAARVIPFTSVPEIIELEPVLKAYLSEAMEAEKSGLTVPQFSKTKENLAQLFPDEFKKILAKNPSLEQAFSALSPGRQRAYLLYFSAPKQSGTRTARVEKHTDRILAGKGIHDCYCGLSKKFPYCDGSHKFLPKEKR